jgi:outer membrane protein TolC
LESDIHIAEPREVEITPDLEGVISQAVTTREELEQLDFYREVAESNLSLNRSGRIPELVAVVDYGFQGEEYRFTSEDDFIMASVVLSWDLFKGFQQKNKISQSKIMLEKVRNQKEETENLIRLEVVNTWYGVLAEKEKVEAAADKEKAALEAFKIVKRKYEEDQASLLEFLDARNTMTGAGQDLIIARYELLSAYARFERSAGLYEFENVKNNDNDE